MLNLSIHIRFVFLFALWLALAAPVFGQRMSEGFSNYPVGSGGEPNWAPDDLSYEVVDEAYRTAKGFSVWQEAPMATSARFACDVTVREIRKGKHGWLVASMGFYEDSENFWALSFSVAPSNRSGDLLCGMHEMLNGKWVAETRKGTRLQRIGPENTGLRWVVAKTYRFEMALRPSRIDGRVLDGDDEVARVSFRLDGDTPAVRRGRPMFRVAGLPVTFDNATVEINTVAEPSPEPASERVAAQVQDVSLRFENRLGWTLVREGRSLYVNGICRFGNGRSKARDVLAAYDRTYTAITGTGFNTVRLWNTDVSDMRLAARHGLFVIPTLHAGQNNNHPNSFDYASEKRVRQLVSNERRRLLAVANEPNIIVWGIGNEFDVKDDVHDAQMWQTIERLAKMVKRTDRNRRPTMTTIATDFDLLEEKVRMIMKHCPSIDILGVNSYGGIGSLSDRLTRGGWNKPFMVTEYCIGKEGDSPFVDVPDRTIGWIAQKMRQDPRCVGTCLFRSPNLIRLSNSRGGIEKHRWWSAGAKAQKEVHGATPQIVSMIPANGAEHVSPNLRELRVTFDTHMAGSHSWVDEGLLYARLPRRGKPRWTEDGMTCILPVSLRVNREYGLSINSPWHRNFRSAEGMPVEPVLYTFSTGQ